MNDLVKTSIDGRKNAIFSAYDVTNQGLIEKIENLFKRINELGESCLDSTDFETKFATSPLNQEYIQLFTEIATSCPQKTIQTETRHVKSDAEYMAGEVASEIKYQAKNATEPARRLARQEAYNQAINTPILGDIIQAKQTADLFGGIGRLFKKKKEDKKEKDEKKKENE